MSENETEKPSSTATLPEPPPEQQTKARAALQSGQLPDGATVFAELANEFARDEGGHHRTATMTQAWTAAYAVFELMAKLGHEKRLTPAQLLNAIAAERGNVGACHALANWCRAVDAQLIQAIK